MLPQETESVKGSTAVVPTSGPVDLISPCFDPGPGLEDEEWLREVNRYRFGYGLGEQTRWTRDALAEAIGGFLRTLGLEPERCGDCLEFELNGRATGIEITDRQAMYDHYEEMWLAEQEEMRRLEGL